MNGHDFPTLFDPETEEEFQARMRDEDRAYEDQIEFEIERDRRALDAIIAQDDYDNAIFDPETDWNMGEWIAGSME